MTTTTTQNLGFTTIDLPTKVSPAWAPYIQALEDCFASLDFTSLLEDDPIIPTDVVITRSSDLVQTISFRLAGTTNEIKRITVTRSAGVVASITTTVYDGNGVTLAETTETFTRKVPESHIAGSSLARTT